MASPATLSSLGALLQSIPQQRAANEQTRYDRGQDALAMALKGRQVDIDQQQVENQAENNKLLRAIQLATAQQTQQERGLDHAAAWANQAPSGTEVAPHMKPFLEQLGFGSQMVEQPAQLPSVAIGAGTTAPQVGRSAQPLAMPSLVQNESAPAKTTFEGTRATDMAEANLAARQGALGLSELMQGLRLDLSKDRLELQRDRPPMLIIQTPEGYMRVSPQGGPATPVMNQGTPGVPGQSPAPGVPGAVGAPRQVQPMAAASLRGEAMKIGPLYSLLDEYRQLTPQVNTASGVERFWQGAKNQGGALTQSNVPAAKMSSLQDRYLAMLSRLSGEVGVLTEQDAERAKAWTPSLYDSKDIADWKLAEFEKFLENKRQILERMNVPMGRMPGQQQPPGQPNRFNLNLPK